MEEAKPLDNSNSQTNASDTQSIDLTVQRKQVAMLERLSDRHQSRLAGRHDTNSIATNTLPSFESTQSFLSEFSKCKIAIEDHLSHVRQNSVTRTPDSDFLLKHDIEKISILISDLEKLVAENAYFLPSYEVRTCLSTISYLKKSVDETSSLVIPKKKFSFKNKSSRKPTNEDKNDAGSEADEVPNSGPGNMGFTGFTLSPGFRNKNNEVLINEFRKGDLEKQNGEFVPSGLRDCEVRLKGCLRALFIDKIINCRVYVGAVMGSVLIEGVEGCVFVLASHQIRIHNARGCDFYLRVRSRPIIEDSNAVRFAPYCLSYNGIDGDLKEANLDGDTENWANVDDFQWLRATQSPNWSILPEDERIRMVDI